MEIQLNREIQIRIVGKIIDDVISLFCSIANASDFADTTPEQLRFISFA